jgi:diacylglycerol kinase family enzyme
MKIAPEARLNDGLFDVVNIGDIKTTRIMRKGYKLYKGTHLDLREVDSLHAKRVFVEPADPEKRIRFETDGEVTGRLPATFEVIPKALKIVVPTDS